MSISVAPPRKILPNLARGGAIALLLFGLLASAGILRAAPAEQAVSVTLTARGGFDGYYKEERWVPLRVTVGNDGPDMQGSLQVSVPRNSGGADVVVSRQVDLPTQSRREVFLYVPVEGYLTSMTVSLVSGKREIATATVRLTQTGAGDLIFGVLAGDASAFNVLADVDPISGSAYVAHLEPADLPPESYVWHALDVLVISDIDTGVFTPEQRAALAGWVAAGGRLIVAGGPDWQKTAAGLAPLLPLAPSGSASMPDISALGAFAQAAAPEGPAVAAIGSLSPDAKVLARAGDLPLVIARPLGFGQVLYLAVDPAFDPLKNWSGLEALYRNLLAGTAQRPSWAAGLRNWYSARDAVDALPGLGLPSALQVCGFLGVYILAVGPLNYLILRRLKRRELAWLTVPGLVVIFSLGAYLTGYQLRGGQASLHRLAVVQVWPGSEYARVDGVVGLFSPRRTQYDLEFGAGFLARPMPSDAYGNAGGSFNVEQTDATVIPAVRMEVGAVEPFVVQGQAPAPQFDSQLSLEVSSSQVTLRGTVANHSSLTLLDAVLLAPGGVQRLGDLAPGASIAINLPLTDSKANAAPVNDILPAQAVPGIILPPGYVPPNNYDSTIDDILGNTYYYNDREQFRRYSLLSAVIDNFNGNVRGNGVFLVGWSDQSPLPAKVLNRKFQTEDRSLYLVNFQPQLNLGTGTLAIPPGLMNWISLGASTSVSPTPYDMYLFAGTQYSLRFMPAQLLPHDKVEALTMHLTSYGLAGPTGLNLDLWDFPANDWVAQPQLTWGDNVLANPERYVGPAGEIEVQAENLTSNQISVERLDFTILVGQ